MSNTEKKQAVENSINLIKMYEKDKEFLEILDSLSDKSSYDEPIPDITLLKLVNHQRNERGKEKKKTSN